MDDEKALLDACRWGDLAAVKRLLAKRTKLALTSYNQTALHMASIDGHVDIAKLLLARGADPNALDKSGATPLITAAEMFARLPYFQLLLENGADPTVRYTTVLGKKDTSVLDALFEREPLRAPVAKLLIEKGAPATDEQLKKVGGAAAKASKQKALLATFDWIALEKHLLAATTKAIARFAKTHKGEVFSRFCFDCNAEAHGSVLFCLDREGSSPSRERAWNPGDWSHQEFGNMDSDKAWRARVRPLGNEDGIETKVAARLLDSIARVALQLEKAGAFKPIQRTKRFESFAIDHDETRASAMSRMKRAGKKS